MVEKKLVDVLLNKLLGELLAELIMITENVYSI